MSDDEYGGGGRDDFDYGGPRYPLSHCAQNQRIVTFEHQFCGRTDDTYDLLTAENEGAAEDGAVEGEAQVNGVNGVEHDQETGNGEEQQPQPTAGAGMTGERQANKVRITTPYLTKYERARILGTRALQIRCFISLRRS
ncbi:hypothetical protein HHX47_DHR1001051 [Lentinula edodes]|nr:hypothetical protein HHX47_DHR1001051 [Lentinula edodes]